MKKLTKKGQVMQNLGALGIGVVTLSLILVVAFIAISLVSDQTSTEGTSNTVINETVVFVTGGGYTALANSANSMLLTCDSVWNSSGGVVTLLDSINYTCGTSGIAWTNGTFRMNQSQLVSYQYINRSNAFNSTEDLRNTTGTIPDWIPLIILVSIGAIIMGLLIVFKR